MIGQSMINISSGGQRNLSGISAALFLLSFILFGSSLIELIPVAALVGVMFMVVLGTFEWGSFRMMKRVPAEDFFVIILVAVVTVFTDLAIAVIVGVIVSALVYAWKHAKEIHAETHTDLGGAKIYILDGPLFFASIHRFNELFDPKKDPDAEFIAEIGAADLLARDQDDLVVERPCLEIIQNSEVIENVQIINGMTPGNITKALSGEHVGTIIYKQ